MKLCLTPFKTLTIFQVPTNGSSVRHWKAGMRKIGIYIVLMIQLHPNGTKSMGFNFLDNFIELPDWMCQRVPLITVPCTSFSLTQTALAASCLLIPWNQWPLHSTLSTPFLFLLRQGTFLPLFLCSSRLPLAIWIIRVQPVCWVVIRHYCTTLMNLCVRAMQKSRGWKYAM